MTVLLTEGRASRPLSNAVVGPEIPQVATHEVLSKAEFALRWNNPLVATIYHFLDSNRAADLRRQAEIGSPGERAETRHLLSKAREDTSKLRKLGLARGNNEEISTGMIFGIKVNSDPRPTHTADQLTTIGDGNAQYKWWYLPYSKIEDALTLNGFPQPETNTYVKQAAMTFITSQDTPTFIDYPRPVDLDPKSAVGILRIARFMRNHGIIGKVPYRTDEVIHDIIRSGLPPSQANVRELPAGNQLAADRKAISA